MITMKSCLSTPKQLQLGLQQRSYGEELSNYAGELWHTYCVLLNGLLKVGGTDHHAPCVVYNDPLSRPLIHEQKLATSSHNILQRAAET